MTDAIAAMLDELMGPQRNAGADEKGTFDFDHPDVCKDFLVGFCCNELFRNTKADMGFCNLFHDAGLKKKYEDSSRRYKLGFEESFLERITRLDNEVRRKIEKNEKRLNLTQNAANSEEDAFLRLREKTEEKKAELTKLISQKMDEAEKAGADGNVSLAQSLVAEADALSKERDSIDDEGRAAVERMHHLEEVANSLNKPMTVCQTCGCFMLVNDAQSRIDDHYAGKMHVAFARIRETIEAMKKEMEDRRRGVKSGSSSRGDRDKDRERRDRERSERDRDRTRKRSRSPRRDRSRDRRDDKRGDRDRERERERDRDRDRERDRDRDRDRRDRDRRSSELVSSRIVTHSIICPTVSLQYPKSVLP